MSKDAGHASSVAAQLRLAEREDTLPEEVADDRVTACPACSSASIEYHAGADFGGKPASATYTCQACGEAFAEPVERPSERESGSCRHGTAKTLAEADPEDLITDGGEPTTHVGEKGLWIPPELREFEAQLVIRTPAVTVQYFSSDGETEAYYPLVRPRHFGPADAFEDLQNPELAPDRVRIKPQGEPAVELTVTGADGPCPAPDATTEGDA
ncbi:hypothetical protein [Haloglomus litoreum]|uniref:hypothetical protein n=1 Tax=Haloglomus litoreum TaxID=3034026 RepID=UPI0023E85CAA|nr:hypothetical protein [Haloglomus sp. DT116]